MLITIEERASRLEMRGETGEAVEASPKGGKRKGDVVRSGRRSRFVEGTSRGARRGEGEEAEDRMTDGHVEKLSVEGGGWRGLAARGLVSKARRG